MAADNPTKTEIDGLFHRLRGQATNKVGINRDIPRKPLHTVVVALRDGKHFVIN